MFIKIIFSLISLYFWANYSIAIPQTQIQEGSKSIRCPLNEKPTDCVGYCLPTCDRPKRPPCRGACLQGCVCKEGYIRETDNGKCVPISSCVNPADVKANYTEPCKENEVATTCVPCVEGTCDYPTPPVCEQIYCETGCTCRSGYVKESPNGGKCIAVEDCKDNVTTMEKKEKL